MLACRSVTKFNAAESRPHPLFLPSFELNTLGSLKNLTLEIHRSIYHRHFWANAIAQLLYSAENIQIETIKIHVVSYIWDASPATIEDIRSWELLDTALVQPHFAVLRSVDIIFSWGIDEEAALFSPLFSAFCVLPKMPLLSELLGEKLYIANHYR